MSTAEDDEDAGKRYHGSVQCIVDALAPHARQSRFVVYGEDMKKATLDVPMLTPHAPMLRALRAVHRNMVFSQSTMVQAMRKLRKQKKSSWKDGLSGKHADQYCVSMAKRVRVMCKHVGRALRGTPTVGWLVTMKMDEPDASSNLEESEASSS